MQPILLTFSGCLNRSPVTKDVAAEEIATRRSRRAAVLAELAAKKRQQASSGLGQEPVQARRGAGERGRSERKHGGGSGGGSAPKKKTMSLHNKKEPSKKKQRCASPAALGLLMNMRMWQTSL